MTGNEKQNNEIAEALDNVGEALRYLGNGNASTPMGAIEGLAMQVRDGAREIAGAMPDLSFEFSKLSEAIENAGENIKEGLADLASAIRETTTVAKL